MPRPKAGPSVSQQLLPHLIDLHRLCRRSNTTHEELVSKLSAFTTEALRICSSSDPRVISDMLKGVSEGPTGS